MNNLCGNEMISEFYTFFPINIATSSYNVNVFLKKIQNALDDTNLKNVNHIISSFVKKN